MLNRKDPMGWLDRVEVEKPMSTLQPRRNGRFLHAG